jgi:hypothetical protein
VALDEEVTGKEGAASAPAVTNRTKKFGFGFQADKDRNCLLLLLRATAGW